MEGDYRWGLRAGEMMRENRKNVVAAGLFFAGVFLMGIGIWRDEATIVFQKAVRICLECIGIG